MKIKHIDTIKCDSKAIKNKLIKSFNNSGYITEEESTEGAGFKYTIKIYKEIMW